MNIQPFAGFSHILWEVTLALAPLLAVFLFFQKFYLKLPVRHLRNIFRGVFLTFWGLALFLQGVHIGFLPVGEMIGVKLGSLPYNWILVPLGLLLGFVATFAEPAVRVLNVEIEKVTSGAIPKKIMLYTLSTGVGISVALAMLRILMGWPLLYLLMPGYALALILLYFSSPAFIAIAFDSGGVATGPMTVTFIMAMAVGSASVIEGRNPLLDGFGLISLVALAPILCVLLLGLYYNKKEQENE